MPNIAWTEGSPSDTSLVAKAPTYMRDVWKQIALGLDESVYWPGSGSGSNDSHGDLRPGTSKAYFGVASALSNPGAGFLMFASDTSQLYAYSSSSTMLVGTPRLMEHKTEYAGAMWLEQFGSYTTDTGGAALLGGAVSFPVTYTGVPTVQVFSGSTNHAVAAPTTGIEVGLFTSQVSGPTGDNTYYWSSLGTVTP